MLENMELEILILELDHRVFCFFQSGIYFVSSDS